MWFILCHTLSLFRHIRVNKIYVFHAYLHICKEIPIYYFLPDSELEICSCNVSPVGRVNLSQVHIRTRCISTYIEVNTNECMYLHTHISLLYSKLLNRQLSSFHYWVTNLHNILWGGNLGKYIISLFVSLDQSASEITNFAGVKYSPPWIIIQNERLAQVY